MPKLERGIGIGCVRIKESKTHKTSTMSISQASKRNWDGLGVYVDVWDWLCVEIETRCLCLC